MAIRLATTGDNIHTFNNLPSITQCTLMGWFYLSADRDAATTFIAYGASTGTNGYWMNTDATGTRLNLWNSATNVTGTDLSLNTWYHLALRLQGTGVGQARVFLNGVLDITQDGSVNPTQTEIWVGNNPSGQWLNGRVAAFKGYGTAQGSTTIQQEMRTYIPQETSGLRLWLPLRDVDESYIDYVGGVSWGVDGTLTTEDGPPIAWSQRPQMMRRTTPPVITTYAPPPFQRAWRVQRRSVLR